MRGHRTFLFAAIVLGFIAAPASGDGSFVKVGDVKGAASEAQHQGWIEIGTWGIETKNSGFSFWPFGSGPKSTFWFEKKADGVSPALKTALTGNVRYERILFDVSIKGDVLRTTLYDARIVSVDTSGPVEKVTLQFKKQTDQRVSFIARR